MQRQHQSLTPMQMQISTRLVLALHPGRDVTLLDSLVLVSRVLLVSLVLCDLGSELALPVN
jgi:hypothetical protein